MAHLHLRAAGRRESPSASRATVPGGQGQLRGTKPLTVRTCSRAPQSLLVIPSYGRPMDASPCTFLLSVKDILTLWYWAHKGLFELYFHCICTLDYSNKVTLFAHFGASCLCPARPSKVPGLPHTVEQVVHCKTSRGCNWHLLELCIAQPARLPVVALVGLCAPPPRSL